MMLYLYCSSANFEKILRSNKLRISIPNELNDPFELLAQTDYSLSLKEAKNQLRVSREKKAYHRELIKSGEKYGYSEFIREYKRDENLFAEHYRRNVPKFFNSMSRDFPHLFSKKNGFLCFSKIYDNILMWGHYADKHRGVVLGFDSNKFVIEDKFIKDVEYSSVRLKYKVVADSDDEENDEILKKIASTKSELWSYEKEVRISCNLRDKDEDGHYYVSFNKSSVVEIYFGVNCKMGDELIKEAKDLGYVSSFFSMQPHKVNYELVRRLIQ